MELTSKQRAQLRALANGIDTIIQIGKEGITESLVEQTNEALKARELIKCRVLENSMLTAREGCDELSRLTRSEQVQVIGTKFVLYRRSHDKTKERIELVQAHKKGERAKAKAEDAKDEAKAQAAGETVKPTPVRVKAAAGKAKATPARVKPGSYRAKNAAAKPRVRSPRAGNPAAKAKKQ